MKWKIFCLSMADKADNLCKIKLDTWLVFCSYRFMKIGIGNWTLVVSSWKLGGHCFQNS
jgi:hypothetical protein